MHVTICNHCSILLKCGGRRKRFQWGFPMRSSVQAVRRGGPEVQPGASGALNGLAGWRILLETVHEEGQMACEAVAYARAGLVGNRSYGYFCKTISFTFRNFAAKVSLYENPQVEIIPNLRER